MPLIVTEKPLSTAENLKLRLIHDSRYINGFLNKIPFSMERLKDFVKQLRTHDRLFAIDISSAYHHVMIAPRFQTLLGFTFEGVDYVYDTLCFGLSFSAYVFCRKTAVTANALRTSGLLHFPGLLRLLLSLFLLRLRRRLGRGRRRRFLLGLLLRCRLARLVFLRGFFRGRRLGRLALALLHLGLALLTGRLRCRLRRCRLKWGWFGPALPWE